MLLLDVDGPLNPYASNPNKRPDGYETHYVYAKTHDEWIVVDRKKDAIIGYSRDYIRFLTNPSHGALLSSLEEYYNIVWATTWNDHANNIIAPLINLPHHPVLPIIHNLDYSDVYVPGVHRKTYSILNFLKSGIISEFPLGSLWIDDLDSLKKNNTKIVSTQDFLNNNIPNLSLYWSNPKIGLSHDDVEILKSFI